jgi:hypothetical protein
MGPEPRIRILEMSVRLGIFVSRLIGAFVKSPFDGAAKAAPSQSKNSGFLDFARDDNN